MLDSEWLRKYFLRWLMTSRTFHAICEPWESSACESRMYRVEINVDQKKGTAVCQFG